MSSYAARTNKASQYAEFFNDPLGELAANGMSVQVDGDELLLAQEVVDWLRSHRTPDDDGHISDDASGLVLWMEGDGLMLTAKP